MSAPAARRAGASLLASIASPARRSGECICRRAALYPQHRSVASSTSRWQQATPATAQKPAARIPEPQTVAPQVNSPEHALSPNKSSTELHSLTEGLTDAAPRLDENEKQVDWAHSFHGLSSTPFTSEQSAVLQQELTADDIEIKPDGILYLPEIKYRRILNKAFGPGGWGLAPRGETIVTGKLVTREYGLVAGGRLISIARGEQQYFDPDGIPTATEGCKSNALMRCCKDLGIASELWDPRFIRGFMKSHVREMIVEHATTKKRRKHYMRKDDEVRYPWKEVQQGAQQRR